MNKQENTMNNGLSQHWKKAIVAALLLSSALVATQVNAAGRAILRASGHWVQDYYDPINRRFLDLVNGAHIIKMEQRYQRGQFDYAVNDLKYSIDHVPNHPFALKKGLEMCQTHPQYLACDLVTEWFEGAIDWTPKEPNAHALYGVHLHNLGQLDAAIEKYKMAIVLKPTLADPHYNLALIYVEQDRYEEAAEHATIAYQLGHRAEGLRRKLTSKGFMTVSGAPTN